MSTRIDQSLLNAAKVAGERHSRSAAQQIDHWARIGREFEAAPSTTHRAVDLVLSGRMSYDALPDVAQTVVRATWDELLTGDIAQLDLTAELRAAGDPWPENDTDGTLIERDPREAAGRRRRA